MKRLLRNAQVVNVFTDSIETADILIKDDRILGVGSYSDQETLAAADEVEDLQGAVVSPGLIDSHVHIESSMLTPAQLTRACIGHGTTAIIADPHEIANVCGQDGIDYMLKASEGLPLRIYFMMPSCVPASPFDESGATLDSADLTVYYHHPRVLGLAEMMDFPGVINGAPEVIAKIDDALQRRLVVNGHAPGLQGHDLDLYTAAGIGDDHECSTIEEALEKLSKGQRIFIRESSAAHNLEALLPLLAEPFNRRCMLCTDDLMPETLLKEGHLDRIIRKAVRLGGDPVTLIRMASIQAAEYFGLSRMGAIAPGFKADLLVLNDLETMDIRDVFIDGQKQVYRGVPASFEPPEVEQKILDRVASSFHCDPVVPDTFKIDATGTRPCRIMDVVAKELITDSLVMDVDFDKANGIDLEHDILKLAVIERHSHTGNVGRGFVHGYRLQHGAVATSVAHDSHNLICIGADEVSMAAAAERVRVMGGGCVVADGSQVLAELPLPMAGLMSDRRAEEIAEQDRRLTAAAQSLGVDPELNPFMNMSFLSLPVIPHLKMSTRGLVDVDAWKFVSLFAD